ncbi:uncharacterized protein [Amphiura filiformis]|uniref:uncharacterized protein n=1 Tax=Amphiura filiformis TaxID=82378 RepID=UPI003B22465C
MLVEMDGGDVGQIHSYLAFIAIVVLTSLGVANELIPIIKEMDDVAQLKYITAYKNVFFNAIPLVLSLIWLRYWYQREEDLIFKCCVHLIINLKRKPGDYVDMILLGVFAFVGALGQFVTIFSDEMSVIERAANGLTIFNLLGQYLLMLMWCDEKIGFKRKYWKHWMYYFGAVLVTLDFLLLCDAILTPLRANNLNEFHKKSWENLVLMIASPFYSEFLFTVIMYLVINWPTYETKDGSTENENSENTLDWETLFTSIGKCKTFFWFAIVTVPFYTYLPISTSAFIIDTQRWQPVNPANEYDEQTTYEHDDQLQHLFRTYRATDIIFRFVLFGCMLNEMMKFKMTSSSNWNMDDYLLYIFFWFAITFDFLFGFAEFFYTFLKLLDDEFERENAISAFIKRITLTVEMVTQVGFLFYVSSKENLYRVSNKTLLFVMCSDVCFWMSTSVHAASTPFRMASMVVDLFGEKTTEVLTVIHYTFRSLFRLQSGKMILSLFVKNIELKYSKSEDESLLLSSSV